MPTYRVSDLSPEEYYYRRSLDLQNRYSAGAPHDYLRNLERKRFQRDFKEHGYAPPSGAKYPVYELYGKYNQQQPHEHTSPRTYNQQKHEDTTPHAYNQQPNERTSPRTSSPFVPMSEGSIAQNLHEGSFKQKFQVNQHEQMERMEQRNAHYHSHHRICVPNPESMNHINRPRPPHFEQASSPSYPPQNISPMRSSIHYTPSKSNSFRTPSPKPKQKKTKKQPHECIDFLRGLCSRGDFCRFVHISPDSTNFRLDVDKLPNNSGSSYAKPRSAKFHPSTSRSTTNSTPYSEENFYVPDVNRSNIESNISEIVYNINHVKRAAREKVCLKDANKDSETAPKKM